MALRLARALRTSSSPRATAQELSVPIQKQPAAKRAVAALKSVQDVEGVRSVAVAFAQTNVSGENERKERERKRRTIGLCLLSSFLSSPPLSLSFSLRSLIPIHTRTLVLFHKPYLSFSSDFTFCLSLSLSLSYISTSSSTSHTCALATSSPLCSRSLATRALSMLRWIAWKSWAQRATSRSTMTFSPFFLRGTGKTLPTLSRDSLVIRSSKAAAVGVLQEWAEVAGSKQSLSYHILHLHHYIIATRQDRCWTPYGQRTVSTLTRRCVCSIEWRTEASFQRRGRTRPCYG